jgi:hypothetical protein
MASPSRTQIKRRTFNGKDIAISMAITFSLCTLPTAFMLFCWSVTKFPPQIFGNNEDHFRGHVINPIPESVKILDVAFDDIMISPEVAYYFRFYVNRNDLNKIISYNSLQSVKLTDDECSLPSYTGPPEWWKIPLSDSVEAYKYESEDLFLKLCYDVSNQIAYYRFWTN